MMEMTNLFPKAFSGRSLRLLASMSSIPPSQRPNYKHCTSLLSTFYFISIVTTSLLSMMLEPIEIKFSRHVQSMHACSFVEQKRIREMFDKLRQRSPLFVIKLCQKVFLHLSLFGLLTLDNSFLLIRLSVPQLI